MGSTMTSGSESGNLAHEWIANTENVKDIQGELKNLKGDIFTKIKEGNANNEYFGPKISNDEQMMNQALDKEFMEIDRLAEAAFDEFAHNHENELLKIIHTTDDAEAKVLLTALQTQFEEYLFNSIDIKGSFLSMKAIAGETVKFELNDLRSQITGRPTNGGMTNGKIENPFPSNMDETNSGLDANKEKARERKEGYHAEDDYLEAYDYTGDKYGNYGVENIYKDSKLRKVMEEIFDDEDKKELKAGTFNINLSKEDGLAGIIIALREIAPYAVADDETIEDTDPNRRQKLICKYLGITYDKDTKEITIGGTQADVKKVIKDLVDQKIFTYEGTGDFTKIAKILTRAKRTDLDTFAGLVQSKDDVEMVVKEWHNAEIATGNILDDKEKRKYNKENGETERTSLINSENVLDFLCDVNGDGILSTEYNKQKNIDQKNQGDVGTLSGPQIMFTIDQAIDVKDAEGKNGENIVIYNIIKNMQISDRNRIIPEVQKKLIDAMMNDESMCTKENLAKIINGIGTKGEEGYVEGMPEFKIFFLDAIKKISGGDNALQPDLYNVLVGEDANAFIENFDEKVVNLEKKIEEMVNQSQDPVIIDMIHQYGLVRVRETVFTALMHEVDNITITGNDGAITQLQAAGIEKNQVTDTTYIVKNEILEQIIQSLVNGAIHYSKEGGLRLTLGIGKNGITESSKTKRSRGGEGGIIVGGGQRVSLYIGASAEIAEQYNYKNVINADLSKVKSAKYLGLEGGAGAQISITDGIGAEVFGGINRQQDPVVGINQIDKQYEDISYSIFNIDTMAETDITNKDKLQSHLQHNITKLETDGKYKKFIENNTQHLNDNLDFVITYLEKNGFFGEKGKIALLGNNKKEALQTLLELLQSGNREERRSNVISGLHGKISLTKLSFGVTTSPVTLKIQRKKNGTNGIATSGGEELPGDIQTGGGESEGGLGQDKFGIAGYYVGARISTWRNSYVPNELQYLYTEYEMGQGIGAKKVENKNNVEQDLNTYVKYLQAFYNTNKLTFKVEGGKIRVELSAQDKDMTIQKYLNIHATTEAEKNFSFENDKTLIIGNVGPIGTYTVAEMKGVRRILCLGTQKLDDAHRIQEMTKNEKIDAIADKPGANKERTQVKINEVADKMTGTGTADINTVKAGTKSFFDENGKLDIPNGKTVEYKNCTIGQTFKNGTLTITKNINGTYEVSYTTSPADKLTINYIDQKEYETQINDANNRTEKEKVSSTEVKNTFAMPTNIQNVFTPSAEQGLSIFDDNYEKTLYKEFMENIVDPQLDSFIDATDYNKAFDIFKNILENNVDYKNFPELKLLIDSNLSDYEKTLIVDKFKTIFSYVLILTDGKIDGANVYAYATGRGNFYTTMKGPDNTTPYPLTKDYKTGIINKLQPEPALTRQRVENLVGFTAFYRLDGKGRKYAMTPIGGTNILASGQLNSITTIDKQDIEKTQEWFINNLNVNTTNKNMLIDKINLLLVSEGVTISEKELPDILRGKGLILDSSKKITIDMEWVFYLLGECGNESIGTIIKGIKIETIKDTAKGRYTATGDSEKEWENGVNIYSQVNVLPSKAISEEEKVGGKFHKYTGIFDPTGRATSGGAGGGITEDPTLIEVGSGEEES